MKVADTGIQLSEYKSNVKIRRFHDYGNPVLATWMTRKEALISYASEQIPNSWFFFLVRRWNKNKEQYKKSFFTFN